MSRLPKLLFLLAVFLLVLLTANGYRKYRKYSSCKTNGRNLGDYLVILPFVNENCLSLQDYVTDISPTTPPTTPEPSFQEVKEFKYRHYDVNKAFYGTEKFPSEILEIMDEDLTPTYCTKTYFDWSGGVDKLTAYDEKSKQSLPLSDPTLIYYANLITKKYGHKDIRGIFICVAKDGDKIIIYSLGPCGGGCSGIPYIGTVSKTGDIQEVKEISENMAYFGCEQPLLLTKSRFFYFLCGGSDGPGGSASVYKLNLNSLNLTKVKYCKSGLDNLENSYTKCE